MPECPNLKRILNMLPKHAKTLKVAGFSICKRYTGFSNYATTWLNIS